MAEQKKKHSDFTNSRRIFVFPFAALLFLLFNKNTFVFSDNKSDVSHIHNAITVSKIKLMFLIYLNDEFVYVQIVATQQMR